MFLFPFYIVFIDTMTEHIIILITPLNYLLEDTGLADINELKTLMKDRDRWKERVLSNNGASWRTA